MSRTSLLKSYCDPMRCGVLIFGIKGDADVGSSPVDLLKLATNFGREDARHTPCHDESPAMVRCAACFRRDTASQTGLGGVESIKDIIADFEEARSESRVMI
ncbi:hypothetical protein OE88DRAFT_1669574 [Heliocybe sulcata]|uniref:Uncharacterized protein n=1 Tax=Heliocybe sulcata TaxID=5364 RepID=A0A5C3MIP3_9AGAM|nr:hypothetical protein OE88DRAFT_1669574 [Heliocybe sulcata]